jgi:hypothetical protein
MKIGYFCRTIVGLAILVSFSILVGCGATGINSTSTATITQIPAPTVKDAVTQKPLYTESVEPTKASDNCDESDVHLDVPFSVGIGFFPGDLSFFLVSNDGILAYDIKTWKKALTFSGSLSVVPDPYYVVSFSPNGNEIAYTDGRQILVWDIHSGNILQNIALAYQTLDGPIDVTYFPTKEGRYRFSAFAWIEGPNFPRTWIVDSCALYPSVPSNCPGAISPDGRKMAFFDWENGITVKNAVSLQSIFTLRDSRNSSNYSFSPDGRFILSLNYSDWSMNVWNVADGELVAVINPNPFGAADGPILGMQKFSYSRDGSQLITYQPRVREIMVWNTEDWKLTYSIKTCDDISAVAVSSDGETISALLSQSIHFWYVDNQHR